jgi:(1->4)-alpha-D-glucan 1-alpha-D-glucosylmutase
VELDGRLELLVWQTLAGTFPISADRLEEYVEKAMREAKLHTSWTSPDEGYETAVREFLHALLADDAVTGLLSRWERSTAEPVAATTLGQKLLQLVLPGVPDVYQGCESLSLSLVDPDNRRPVDHARLDAELGGLEGWRPGGAARETRETLDLPRAKLLVTSRALRLRREHPEWFTGTDATYAPVATTSGSALAVGRGDADGVHVVAVMTRLSVSLERFGGWGEHTVALPEAEDGWVDELTGRTTPGGTARLADLMQDLPVVLLRRA